jgi:hypothetical protein
VLGYGFTFINAANTWVDYARFLFAYFIIILDWIYVHQEYWGWEYKYNDILALDLAILLTFSRLTYTSTIGDPKYWLWLCALFFFYAVWDLVSHLRNMPSRYDWRYCLVGDFVGCLGFFAFYRFAAKAWLSNDWRILLGILIYGIAFPWWFKHKSQSGVGRTQICES